jgi:hypothetical protein
MQKLLIGVLGLLALYFAAANARLAERTRGLESRLAAEGVQRRPRPIAPVAAARETTAPAPPGPVPTPTPGPTQAPAVDPVPEPKVRSHVQTYLQLAAEDVHPVVSATKWLVYNQIAASPGWTPIAPDLGLSESQKRAIEDLKKNQDLQTRAFKDQIQAIDEQTEQAIRRLLTSEQLAKYSGESGGSRELPQILQPQESPSLASPRTGYLGVSAANASGGGAQIDQVMANSAAQAYGLQVGDVILECNGSEIKDFEGLSSQILQTLEGSPAALKIRRGGTEFYQSVVMGGRK